MSYTMIDEPAARQEAARLTARCVQLKAGRRFEAQPYERSANGRDVLSWGVMAYELGYHKDGSERLLGFVWKPTTCYNY